MKRVLVFILGGAFSAALILLALFLAGRRSAPPEQTTRRIAQDRFVANRKYEISKVKPTVSHDVSPRTIRLSMPGESSVTIAPAVNPYEELQNGDERWANTVLHLSDFAYLREERLACAEQHALSLISNCRGVIDMIFDASATSRFGEVLAVESSAEPDTPEDAPACTAYVECLANGRIGSVIPLPPDLVGTGKIALTLDTVYTWASPAMFDVDMVAELIASREADLRQGIESGKLPEFERASEELLIDYLREHLSGLRGKASGDGSP